MPLVDAKFIQQGTIGVFRTFLKLHKTSVFIKEETADPTRTISFARGSKNFEKILAGQFVSLAAEV